MFLRDPLFCNCEVCRTPNVAFPIFPDIFEKLSIPQFLLFAMSDRYKCEFLPLPVANYKIVLDAINGIYKCDNFAEQVEQNHFPEIYIGVLANIPRWYEVYSVKT